MQRRHFLQLLSAAGAVGVGSAFASQPEPVDLERMERDLFLYFRERTLTAGPLAGLTPDRAPNFGDDHPQKNSNYGMLSIAATGLGLAAMIIGAERGWITREEARQSVLRTLRTVQQLPAEHGWHYHFFDAKTGEPMPWSEVSTIDTGTFLLGGVVAAGEYFGGEVEQRAQQIFNAIDFQWAMTNGGAMPGSLTLSMGWNPARAGKPASFIRARWDSYTSELLLLYILGMGRKAAAGKVLGGVEASGGALRRGRDVRHRTAVHALHQPRLGGPAAEEGPVGVRLLEDLADGGGL